jgi:hypothetical protein
VVVSLSREPEIPLSSHVAHPDTAILIEDMTNLAMILMNTAMVEMSHRLLNTQHKIPLGPQSVQVNLKPQTSSPNGIQDIMEIVQSEGRGRRGQPYQRTKGFCQKTIIPPLKSWRCLKGLSKALEKTPEADQTQEDDIPVEAEAQRLEVSFFLTTLDLLTSTDKRLVRSVILSVVF